MDELNKKIDELTTLASERGFSCLVGLKDKWGQVYTHDYKLHKDSPPVCHRFSEVAACRTKLIDATLLIRDCFIEAATAYQTGAVLKPVEVREYSKPDDSDKDN